jgi:uncharacterized membrane protein YfcA
VLLVGGIFGSTIGAGVFALLRAFGQLDLVISLLYVAFLGTVGGLMLVESVNAIRQSRAGNAAAAAPSRPAQLDPQAAAEDALPHIEAVRQRHPVLGLGAAIGFLAAVMGVGGGFIMVPAMIYLLKVPTNVVIGTSLFQIMFVTAYTTIVQASVNQTVDIVLAFLLMVGGVAGAQYGAKVGQKLRGDQLRALLAALVLAVALRLAFDLFVAPGSVYEITGPGGQ